ncbi:MAG: hypothetical protein E7525_03520 [Ruminococcaceae bacterium]|nr:hypothetical protein [Oscillospiraceae bacterium]
MIEIHPLRDREKLVVIYAKYSVPFGDDSIAIVASDGDELLGCCLFDLDKSKETVHYIDPQDDIMFADGLLRSALHVAVENGIESAFYSENAPVSLFERLQFIKNAETRELNVEKLFTSCKNC